MTRPPRPQDPSVIFEEGDQDQDHEERGSKEAVSIRVEHSTRDAASKKGLEVEEDARTYTMTRSHSISSSSDISRLDGTPCKNQEELGKGLTAHSLTDVTACDNPSCQIKNRSHRHSTPGRLCSYLRLCSVVDLPALGTLSLPPSLLLTSVPLLPRFHEKPLQHSSDQWLFLGT